MKTLSTSLKAIVVASLACTAAIALAGGTQNVKVNATVLTVCKFTGAALDLTFADIDPSLPGPVTKKVAVPFSCTKGTTTAAVTYTGGTTLTETGGTTMTYSLSTITVPGGLGFSAPSSFDVTANIATVDYQDAVAGAYTDTVVLTINH